MKTSKHKLYSFLCLIVLSTSCGKNYLETSPTDQISSSSVFSSIGNVKLALNGIYRLLYTQISNQSQDGQSAMIINMDAMGEDLVWSGNTYSYFKPALRWVDHRNESSALALYPYTFYYRIISNANMIINSIEAIEGDETEKNGITGEALALRAWAHFQLVQIYGKRYAAGVENSQPGIPIMLENSTEGVPRASVEEVYKQINADLDLAIADLSNAPARSYKTHINVNVAKGLKARVALTMQDWATAARFAHEAREGFSLMSNADYLAGFTSLNNVEWMWGIVQTSDQVPTYGSFYAYMSENYNSSWNRLEPKMINSVLYKQISATDIRKKIWWDGTAAEKANFTGAIDVSTGTTASTSKIIKYMHRKFVVPDYTNRAGDIPYMRTAEMYLIEAEALARSGQDAAAATALYPLAVNRDPSYLLSTKTGQALIEEIMIQRRVELWGEGFRFFDLKRTDSPLNRSGMDNPLIVGSSVVSYTDARYVTIAYTLGQGKPSETNVWEYKIPQSEIDANDAINPEDQNP